MLKQSKVQQWLPVILWICALIALVAWALSPGYVVGWDLNVYKAALLSLRSHHDPYADAIAIQRIFHAQGPHPDGTPVPFCYVYSPITLLVVGAAAKLPLGFDGVVYWTAYIVAAIFAVWFGLQFLDNEREKKAFAFLAPAAVFFPGLLQTDVIFSGNVAYILYALVFLGSWIGWKKGTWLPFYAIMVVVSCVKAPLLILVVIAVMSARKQWAPTLITIVISVALFLMQPHIWPTLYQNYLTGVELQFSFNRDFSASPAGITADALFEKLPYKLVWGGFWVVTTLVFGSILLWLRKQFLAGKFPLNRWVPVMIVGVALLNPRIMEYDVAPITLLMALVVWRVFGRGATPGRQVFDMVFAFVMANAFDFAGPWRPPECLTLCFVFFAGSWDLYRLTKESGRTEPLAS